MYTVVSYTFLYKRSMCVNYCVPLTWQLSAQRTGSQSVHAFTFRRMTRSKADIKRRRHCLMNQVVHRTHCCRPIINIDSLIRVSFSNTNSWERTQHFNSAFTCTSTYQTLYSVLWSSTILIPSKNLESEYIGPSSSSIYNVMYTT